jgi:hypothetical protein
MMQAGTWGNHMRNPQPLRCSFKAPFHCFSVSFIRLTLPAQLTYTELVQSCLVSCAALPTCEFLHRFGSTYLARHAWQVTQTRNWLETRRIPVGSTKCNNRSSETYLSVQIWDDSAFRIYTETQWAANQVQVGFRLKSIVFSGGNNITILVYYYQGSENSDVDSWR